MKRLVLMFFLLFISVFTTNMNAQTVVIVNESVEEKKLSQRQILEVYTLNQARWEDGARITIFDQKKNDRTKADFYKYLDIEREELRKIWLRKQFTGKASPPKVVDSEKDVLEQVESTPGAIGYVSVSTAKKSKKVKIVARLK